MRPWVKLPGQRSHTMGTARVTVAADGSFTWSRKSGKKTYVYFASESGVRSKGITIPAAKR